MALTLTLDCFGPAFNYSIINGCHRLNLILKLREKTITNSSFSIKSMSPKTELHQSYLPNQYLNYWVPNADFTIFNRNQL